MFFWHKNLFLLPSGSCGKGYIEETTKLLNEWIHGSPLNVISFKAVMLIPNLLLQKPSKNSKSKDHQLALERRLELWHKGEFEELYIEGKTIQASLKTTQNPSSIAEISKKFKQEMAKGNINSALKLLTNNMENRILPLNKDTLSKLIQKHPKGKTASQDILLNGALRNIHPIKLQSVDEEMIRKAAIRTKVGSGPSGMNANGWHRILASNNFGTSSVDHLKAFANVVQKLCTDLVETHTIGAFLSCRLIPLDKNPGLRPIEVGEVLRRIVGKVIVSVLKQDVIKCTGKLMQVVDASNAFNSLNNRQSFLRNISYLCPSIAIFVINCYSTP